MTIEAQPAFAYDAIGREAFWDAPHLDEEAPEGFPAQRIAVPLPGISGSAEYMSAYQDAIAAALPRPIGASRTVPGTVDAAIVAYHPGPILVAVSPKVRASQCRNIELG
jgi:hypothetical protein